MPPLYLATLTVREYQALPVAERIAYERALAAINRPANVAPLTMAATA